jgi:hypothetical protein
MLDEQQEAPADATSDDAPEGAVSAEDLKDIPGPPNPTDDDLEGPRAAAEERARQAAEHAQAAATADADAD